MSLDDLMGNSNPKPKKEVKKVVQKITQEEDKPKQFSVYAKESTIQLMDELQWLKDRVIDLKHTTREDILLEALNLLADKVGYDKLKKKYSKQLEGAKPKRGRV